MLFLKKIRLRASRTPASSLPNEKLKTTGGIR